MNKEFLRNHNLLFSVNPNELISFEEWCEYLESLLSGRCYVMATGGKLTVIEIKAYVASIGGLKIEIYPNEHTPPHFHVKSPKIDASFRIDNCECIEGKVSSGIYNIILYWYTNGAKALLIDKWNSTRPTNCVVGKYSE